MGDKHIKVNSLMQIKRPKAELKVRRMFKPQRIQKNRNNTKEKKILFC
jgi:hypothetical protein